MSAAQAIRTVTANIPKACGFTISGIFEDAAFTIDGWFVDDGTSTYGALGTAHLVWVGQVSVTDFYRAGGAEYVRLSVYGPSTAATRQEVRGLWPVYGITSKAVINAAGFTKWVKLPHPLPQTTNLGRDSGPALTAGALAAEVSQGGQLPPAGPAWRLDGTATVHGVRCTVLVDPPGKGGVQFDTDYLYVDTATGLPLQIGYRGAEGLEHVWSFLGNWGHVAAVNPPPASEVVAG
jgi:hypothetical protein